MPGLAEQLDTAAGKPAGTHKLIRKNSAYTLLVLDEWLLGQHGERVRYFLLEGMEHCYDTAGPCSAPNTPSRTGTNDWEAT